MRDYFDFQRRQSDQLTLSISPTADFREVLATLDSIGFPAHIANADNIKYAILELVSNSIRAHREREVATSIRVTLRARGGGVAVEVRDHGGGFDPALLPYSLEEQVQNIRQDSPRFEEYRRRYDYRRFGMGLLLTKRTFPRFALTFFDETGRPVRWGEAAVKGTVVSVST
jgi:anti-sigma regulatory factor (Ser/Thr protein kinase)